MLQKKIDGERLEIPLLDKNGFCPWYGNEVERDIPDPGAGPDLIDLRTVEIAAERTALGLVDAHEAGLEKPPKIPRPAARARAPTPSRSRARRGRGRQGAEQDRHDPRQGSRRSARGRSAPRRPPAADGTRPRRQAGGKKAKRAEARPTLVWLGDAKLAELAGGSMPSSARAPSRSSRPALLVPAEKLVDVALYLRDQNPIKYDYLASLQSVHYEDCIEVNYQLDSIESPGTLIELRVRTAEAEGQGEVPRSIDVYRGADFQEREVYDMMGVRFTGHPELTRILMWDGFAYYPLRKDFLEPYYEGPTKVFPSRVDEGSRPAFPRRGGQSLRHQHEGPQGLSRTGPASRAAADPKGLPLMPGGVEITELDTDQFIVSMGPQHPSTHGVFRLNLRVDGETIVGLKPVMGYMHRNHEKIGERNTFLMNFPFTDRLDYLTSMGNNFGYALAVEQLMGDDAKPPERAEYIRVIMAELTRIASHMWSIGFLLNDLGAFFTPALYAIEERELILDLFEWAAGSRMMCNYFRFGGVAFDLPPGWIERCRGIVNDRIDKKIDELDRYLSQNEIVLDRTKGVGVLTREQAINFSTAGPVLRASGVDYDIRRAAPYSIYDRFDFNVITARKRRPLRPVLRPAPGNARERRILKQAVRDIPGGPILPGKKSYQIKVPAGEAYSRVENPKGELGYYVFADGSPTAYRYHVRSPSFINLTALEAMCLGHTIADVVGILGSLDIVLGEVDR